MKRKLERIAEIIRELMEQTNDDELIDNLDDAANSIDYAIDRIIAIEEELDESELEVKDNE